MMNEETSVNDAEASLEKPEKPKSKGAKKVKKVEKTAKKVAKKVAKTNGHAKPKESAEGLVTVADLAEEAKISPQSVRVKLRAAELDRGEGRWKWEEGSKALKQARKVLGLES